MPRNGLMRRNGVLEVSFHRTRAWQVIVWALDNLCVGPGKKGAGNPWAGPVDGSR